MGQIQTRITPTPPSRLHFPSSRLVRPHTSRIYFYILYTCEHGGLCGDRGKARLKFKSLDLDCALCGGTPPARWLSPMGNCYFMDLALLPPKQKKIVKY